MTNSIFRAGGLSLGISEPAWRTPTPLGDFSSYVTDYSHVSVATGGFYQASFKLRLPASQLEDWYDNALGRKVTTYTPGRGIAWQGLINQVELSIGGYRLSIGPYLDIANKVMLIYSAIDTSTGAAITGLRLATDYLTDQASIAKYGILPQVLSASGISADNVDELLGAFLTRSKRPARSEDLTLPSPAPTFDLAVDCVGFVRLLEKYPYNNTATGLVNISDKLKAILQADPNGLLGTDLTNITTNTLQVSSYEQDNAAAWGLIKSLLAQGDSSLQRYTFGIYEDLKAYYGPQSTTVQYVRPLREAGSVFEDQVGGRLYPWEVRPGAWVWVADLLPARQQSADLNEDPRAMYAETVTFRAPDSLTINGSHSFKVEQRLAQMGLAGVS